jgi:hypothetical protein
LHEVDRGFRFQGLFAEDPRSIRERVLSLDFASLHREPEGSRAHAKKRSSFDEIHLAFRGSVIAFIYRDAMMTTQRSNSFARPSVASSRKHSVPVQNAGNQIVGADPR